MQRRIDPKFATLNNISYAPHILLMNEQRLMGHNLLYFHFNLFGIDRTIPSSNTNDSVAFQSFTILNMGYKTKVIILTPRRSTMNSNEEKEMIKSRKNVILAIHVLLG